MLPTPHSSLLARRALRFQGAALAIRTPVAVHIQAFLDARKAPNQYLTSWANVFIFSGVKNEGIFVETPVRFSS